MTSKEFDDKVISVANSFGNNPEITYGITGLGETSGNCNSSTSTILNKSGVSSEKLSEIRSSIPGVLWGFGKIKPWTKQEQRNAVEELHKQAQRLAEELLIQQ